MADVYVSNWSEFVEAVAVAGDTVILPEAERWDMNVIAPEGVTGNIPVNCAKIIGNGTSVWNGRFYGSFQVSGTEVQDFHIINYFSDSVTVSGTGVFSRCMFSGLSAAIGGVTLIGTSWHRCAFNVELQHGEPWAVSGECTYCRIILHAARAIGTNIAARNAVKKNCEIIMYMPAATHLYMENAQYCTIRGNMAACGYIGNYSYDHGSAYTIVDTDDLAEGASVYAPLIGVTDAQMKDAAYLASIGFPIGGGDDA